MKNNTIDKGTVSTKTIAAMVIFILFLLFLLQNTVDVDIRFLFWKVTLSRVLLLFGSLIVGCIIGILIGWEWFGRRKNKNEKIKQTPPDL